MVQGYVLIKKMVKDVSSYFQWSNQINHLTSKGKCLKHPKYPLRITGIDFQKYIIDAHLNFAIL